MAKNSRSRKVIKDFCLESCGNGRDYKVPYWGIAVVDLLQNRCSSLRFAGVELNY